MGTEEEVEEVTAVTQSDMWNCFDRDRDPRGTSDGVVKSIFKQRQSFYTKTIDQYPPVFKYTVFPFSAHCLSVKLYIGTIAFINCNKHLKKEEMTLAYIGK